MGIDKPFEVEKSCRELKTEDQVLVVLEFGD